MTKPFIFVTREIPEEGIKILEDIGDVEIYRGDTAPPREILLKKAEVADALLTLLTEKIDRDVLTRAKKLKIVANYAVGYDNIDTKTATELGIMVTNTPDVLTEATAELTIALMLAVTRRLKEATELLQKGMFRGWHPLLMLGDELKGKKLGVVGMGRIGRRVAEIARRGFDMQILYFSKTRKEEVEKELGARYLPLDVLLKECDILTIHVPLTEETDNLISKERLMKLKKGAYVINTSRGRVIDEETLIALIKEGRIKGAGLDVFRGEPEIRRELLELPQVIVTPHIGSATIEARTQMVVIAATSIREALQGKVPKNLVNKEVLNAPSLRIQRS